MKVFIAGARAIKTLDSLVLDKLKIICEKKLDIIIGDCYGVDAAVQKFCAELSYSKVTIFASNGKVRNNLGNWSVYAVPVESSVKGFDFYRQKDIVMAENADYGFMIWDGKSKGTYQNIVTLLNLGKTVAVYQSQFKRVFQVKTNNEFDLLLPKPKKAISDMGQQLTLF